MTAAGFVRTDADDVMARVPLAWLKIIVAENAIMDARQLFACRHVIDGSAATACTEHTEAGLFCIACMAAHHLPRHNDTAEHRCDQCLEVFAALKPVVCTSYVEKATIREPRGRRRRFAGGVTFIAVGCCTSCWGPA